VFQWYGSEHPESVLLVGSYLVEPVVVSLCVVVHLGLPESALYLFV
jgi:hypothetical protein